VKEKIVFVVCVCFAGFIILSLLHKANEKALEKRLWNTYVQGYVLGLSASQRPGYAVGYSDGVRDLRAAIGVRKDVHVYSGPLTVYGWGPTIKDCVFISSAPVMYGIKVWGHKVTVSNVRFNKTEVGIQVEGSAR